ncbi:hypothetical protein BC831DRAFT_485434 [Entophlyctis helioformis]|nr:hypothetical protein BC831DRAFT_485434 [Entophlyctis helioformis]
MQAPAARLSDSGSQSLLSWPPSSTATATPTQSATLLLSTASASPTPTSSPPALPPGAATSTSPSLFLLAPALLVFLGGAGLACLRYLPYLSWCLFRPKVTREDSVEVAYDNDRDSLRVPPGAAGSRRASVMTVASIGSMSRRSLQPSTMAAAGAVGLGASTAAAAAADGRDGDEQPRRSTDSAATAPSRPRSPVLRFHDSDPAPRRTSLDTIRSNPDAITPAPLHSHLAAVDAANAAASRESRRASFTPSFRSGRARSSSVVQFPLDQPVVVQPDRWRGRVERPASTDLPALESTATITVGQPPSYDLSALDAHTTSRL